MFRFEKLDEWKRSISLTDTLFDPADQIDLNRKYRFAEQPRSAGLLISNNIAERPAGLSSAEFQQFLNYAHRSVSKTVNMNTICCRRKFIENTVKQCHLDELEAVSRMLVGYSNLAALDAQTSKRFDRAS